MEYRIRQVFMQQYIEIGKIVNTHGVWGAVKVEPWCDSPEILSKMKKVFFPPVSKGGEFREVKILKGSIQKDRVLLTLEGTESVEQAILLKNKVIYAHRDDIPIEEGSFLICDLIGHPVIDVNTGVTYGTLSDVIQGAASDIYEIKTEKGTTLIPAVKEFIKETDLSKGIFVSPIKGMFDEI